MIKRGNPSCEAEAEANRAANGDYMLLSEKKSLLLGIGGRWRCYELFLPLEPPPSSSTFKSPFSACFRLVFQAFSLSNFVQAKIPLMLCEKTAVEKNNSF